MKMAGRDGGVITVLPQLAATVAVNKRLTRRDTPLLSWLFNTALERGPGHSSFSCAPGLR